MFACSLVIYGSIQFILLFSSDYFNDVECLVCKPQVSQFGLLLFTIYSKVVSSYSTNV
jgi:hypothetical protein